ncbi:MAG: hypothetical protein ACRCV3_02850 [Desulfovibrionaceae bacterium]
MEIVGKVLNSYGMLGVLFFLSITTAGFAIAFSFLRIYVVESIFYKRMLLQYFPLFIVFFLLSLCIEMAILLRLAGIIFLEYELLLFYAIGPIVITVVSIWIYSRHWKNELASFWLYFANIVMSLWMLISFSLYIYNVSYVALPLSLKTMVYNIPASSWFWVIVAQAVPFMLISSHLVMLLYAMFRRNKDSYGRDYYIFSMKYSMKWELFASFLSILASIFFFYSAIDTIPHLFTNITFIAQGVLPLCISLYIFIAFVQIAFSKENPLRYKISVLLSTAFLFLGIYTQSLFFRYVTQ